MRKRYPVFLSKDDSVVPDNFIGIHSIFSEEKYALPGYSAEEWCLGGKALDEMRVKTYKETKKRFDLSGANSFAAYWNCNLDSINDLGINEFSKLSCFSELCTAMMCFEKTIQNKHNTNKRKYVGFGIRKKIYENYYKSIKESIETGNIPKKVDLFDPKKKRRSELSIVQKTTLYFDSDNPNRKYAIEVGKNELYLMFEQWCKLSGETKKDALYKAMRLLMEQNPIKGLEDSKLFARNIDVEKNEIIVNSKCKQSSVKVNMSGELYEQILGIIKRYNLDPENASKSKLNISSYATQAFSLFNKKIPLKYSDPVAFKEYLKLKDETEYNNS